GVPQPFRPRAFGRPVTAGELERHLGVFDKADRLGLPYDQAIRASLKSVLIAPSFLFLTVTPPESTGVYRLDHHEVAAHLSYFLWASMPDDELTGLAGQGRLHDPAVLREQVRRMARDPKSRALAD